MPNVILMAPKTLGLLKLPKGESLNWKTEYWNTELNGRQGQGCGGREYISLIKIMICIAGRKFNFFVTDIKPMFRHVCAVAVPQSRPLSALQTGRMTPE